MEDETTGCIVSTKDIRDYKIKLDDSLVIPAEFCLNSVPVKNQRPMSTCTAHVLAQIVEYHTREENDGEFYRYSTNYIYANKTSAEEEGMSFREGLNWLKHHGDVLYDECPGNYNIHKAKKTIKLNEIKSLHDSRITAYYKMSKLEEIKQSLLVDGPVGATIKMYDKYRLHNGVYSPDYTTDFTDHAVMIIGWTKENFIVQNSWGTLWGKKGIFYVRIEDIDKVFREFYGVTDNIDTVIQPSFIVNKTAKFINLILNFIIQIIGKIRT